MSVSSREQGELDASPYQRRNVVVDVDDDEEALTHSGGGASKASRHKDSPDRMEDVEDGLHIQPPQVHVARKEKHKRRHKDGRERDPSDRRGDRRAKESRSRSGKRKERNKSSRKHAEAEAAVREKAEREAKEALRREKSRQERERLERLERERHRLREQHEREYRERLQQQEMRDGRERQARSRHDDDRKKGGRQMFDADRGRRDARYEVGRPHSRSPLQREKLHGSGTRDRGRQNLTLATNDGKMERRLRDLARSGLRSPVESDHSGSEKEDVRRVVEATEPVSSDSSDSDAEEVVNVPAEQNSESSSSSSEQSSDESEESPAAPVTHARDEQQEQQQESSDSSSEGEHENAVEHSGDDRLQSKFDDEESPQDTGSESARSSDRQSRHDDDYDANDDRRSDDDADYIAGDGYLQETPPPSPTELKPDLPPYYPALQGCRNVEEFQCLNRIEEGTYGVVYRALDKKTNEIVALKRLKMEKEKEGFPITSLREINTLLKSKHPNVVTVREIVVGSNMDKIYIVMDYVEHDLKSLMEYMKEPFIVGEVKTLLRQLLRGVAHLHDNWIIHRDLKTSNLLLSHKGILKIGDFGLAREYGSPLRPYTPIVVTLWYRAPELLLGAKQYTTPIDLWSVGCIFAEFLTKKPLFPGKSEIDELNRIFKELGTPNETIWKGVSELSAMKKCTFTEYPYNQLRNRFGNLLSDKGFDLLNRFLTYNPDKRITAIEALKHEFFRESPLPVDPSMFPTWPAKSEQSRQRTHGNSPKPPSGGKAYAKLLGDDDELGSGFHLPIPSHGASSTGLGFALKF